MTWEIVYETPSEIMDRAAVDGGWIYRLRERQGSEHGGYTWSGSMCFVPEPAAPPAARR